MCPGEERKSIDLSTFTWMQSGRWTCCYGAEPPDQAQILKMDLFSIFFFYFQENMYLKYLNKDFALDVNSKQIFACQMENQNRLFINKQFHDV